MNFPMRVEWTADESDFLADVAVEDPNSGEMGERVEGDGDSVESMNIDGLRFGSSKMISDHQKSK